MGKPRICVLPPLSLLTTKELKIFQYRWKFLRLAGFESHPLRYLSSTTTLPNGPKKWAQCRSDHALADSGQFFELFRFLDKLLDRFRQTINQLGSLFVASVAANDRAVNFEQLDGFAQNAGDLFVVHDWRL